MEKCIGCELCAGVCPAELHLRARRRQRPREPDLAGRALRLRLRDQLPPVHPLRPVRRGVPDRGDHRVEAVRVLVHDRQEAIYTKDELVVDDEGRPKRLPWEDWREGDDVLTSGWMRATSPSGDATFEGEVGWSNELGHGCARPSRHRPSATRPTDRVGRSNVDRRDLPRVRRLLRRGADDARRRVGVVTMKNPVHAALGLVLTLFGVAVQFVAQEAHFLAAVQVIVYAGAIVVLFLFVIMLLGVDKAMDLSIEPIKVQTPARRRDGRRADRAASAPRSSRPATPVDDRPGTGIDVAGRDRAATTRTSASSPRTSTATTSSPSS